MKLWKTTITIWSDYDPSEMELDQIAYEAISGDMYCSYISTDNVETESDEDWDGTEFFDINYSDDDTDSEEITKRD